MTSWVVMRSRNDIAVIEQTLLMLANQSMGHRLLVFDNASTDGTRKVVAAFADRVIDVPEGQYIPGKVLNQSMRETDGDFVYFINSDCTPTNKYWLERLQRKFTSTSVVAVFGRQVPRENCDVLFAKDTEGTFGDGSRQAKWRHCFSMASSGIRRTAWEELSFREDLFYSEDIDWTWRQRQLGREVLYVPESVVVHSHNYTLRQWYKRQYGEGKAEAAIFKWDDFERSFLRYSLMPFFKQVLSDWHYGISNGHPSILAKSPPLRIAQLLGRRAGFVSAFRSGDE